MSTEAAANAAAGSDKRCQNQQFDVILNYHHIIVY